MTAANRTLSRTAFCCLVLVLAFLFAFPSPQARAEAEPGKLSLSKGQTLKWNLRKWKRTTQQGTPTTEGESTTPVTLRVLDTTPDGYAVELQHGRTKIAGLTAEAEQALEAQGFLTALDGVQVKVALSADGAFGDILNFEEARAAALKVIELVGKSRGGAGGSDSSAFLEQVFSSKEGLANMFLKDVPILTMAAAFDPTTGEPMEYETELPNMFGGAPLKARGRVIAKTAEAKGTAEFDVEQEVDKDTFIAMMTDMGNKANTPIPAGELETLMKDGGIKDTMRFVVDLSTGVADFASVKRVTNIQGGGREDLTEFTRVRE